MLTLKHVESDETSTERPVLVDQKEEHGFDFRLPGLSHSVVKEAEHLRVEAFQANLQQNNVYNPFSNNSKAAKWVMWSWSSCAELYQKYNVLTVFFSGIKELCTALADNS